MVKGFFQNGFMSSEINHSHIILIPKIDSPCLITHYRPISLCNVTYKLIANILVKRLRLVMANIISPLRSAFVQGRLIQDNSVLTHEVFHMLRKKRSGRKFMDIKADIEKAYDRMEWVLILQALKCFGFNAMFINWISQCILTVSYSILLNGPPFGFFQPSRGLRQGDPLSPLLFIIGSEVFSRMFIREEQMARLHGIPLGRNVPPILHLLFADDLLIFSRATSEEAHVLSDCLHKYGNWSGQRLNSQKYSITFSRNVSNTASHSICSILQLPRKDNIKKRLGIPMVVARNKHQQFKFICERVKSRLEGWQMKTLSQAGQLVLIRSVAVALLTYTMANYVLPKAICSQLDSMMMQFWWDFPNDTHHHLCLKSWVSICRPKRDGGLGLKLVEDHNKALIVKMGWQILNNPEKMWVQIIHAKYMKSKFIWDCPVSVGASWFWRGITRVANILKEAICYQIGSGEEVRV